MGRTEPTVVKPPAAFRRDARAKRARATVNKVIPALLVAHPRAQRGIQRSELIIDPPPFTARDQGSQAGSLDDAKEVPKATGAKRSGRRRTGSTASEEPQTQPQSKQGIQSAQRDDRNVNGSHGISAGVPSPRITLAVADTLEAAHALLESGEKHKRPQHGIDASHAPDKKVKVGILNMASPLSPGGGFLNGATSQEESLCMRTTLLPGLRDEFYRLPELGMVYTPDVLVFRSSSSAEDILPKNDRWFVDVVSAAMLRLPETEDGRYASNADRELVLRKMRGVMRVFAACGCSRVVLGAWGCGAYGNPVVEIAEAWRRVLAPSSPFSADANRHVSATGEGDNSVSGHHRSHSDATARGKKKARRGEESWGAVIEDVVFAIKDVSLATAFARAFGEDVLPVLGSGKLDHDSASSTASDEEGEDPAEVARVGELQGKIQELEARVRQARNPHLRTGLETVLAGLRRQLPAEVDEGDAVSSEGEEEGIGDDGEQGDTIDVVENGLYATGAVGIGTR